MDIGLGWSRPKPRPVCAVCGKWAWTTLVFDDLVGEPEICSKCVANALGLRFQDFKPEVAKALESTE